jgi:iron complex outermembrane recepter protein
MVIKNIAKLMKIRQIGIHTSILFTSILVGGGVSAQSDIEEIVVIGSQITGLSTTGALPVTVVGQDELDAIGVSNTEDLLRAIPQIGEIQFNSDETGTSSNNVRGDIASLNLRGLGADATLSLVNGRRLVTHPGSTTVNGVPIHFVNLNAVPSLGLDRVEVLLDGAAALYGSDAISGVVNSVLDTDYEGFKVQLRHGFSQGTTLDETTLKLQGGWALNNGATNVTMFASLFDRTGMDCSEREYCVTPDKRDLLPAEFADDTSALALSTLTPLGNYRAGVATGDFGASSAGFTRTEVSQNGSAITSSSGQFHFEPTGYSSGVPSNNTGLDLDSGSVPVPLRYAFNGPGLKALVPDTGRNNIFTTITHELDSGMEFFGEFSYYDAETETYFAPHVVSGSNNMIVPAASYWNPFGPTGSVNRLANIDAPAEGYDMDIEGLRLVDSGLRTVTVDNSSIRFLAGLRGQVGDWDWEGAAYRSDAESVDSSRQMSRSLFYDAVSRTDATAYNPFDGDTMDQDASEFIVDVNRSIETSLTGADFKISTPNLFDLPAGTVGAAVGTEFRQEEWSDDRDERLDGTDTFTNPITGEFFSSSIMGVSATPDSSGDRDVFSAYAELAVPLLADAPLVQSLDAQVAARYESYSDVGDILKPKVALAWTVNDMLLIRTAWSEGFRAPNLETINQSVVSRFSNSQEDFLACSVTGEGCSVPITTQTLGNPDLQPEESENITFGVVLTPTDWLDLTLDFWSIEQTGVVGVFGRDSTLVEDIVLRSRGSSSDRVVRFDATAADIAATDAFNLATGRNIAAVGELQYVEQTFENLSPRKIEGYDFTAGFSFPDTSIGSVNVKFNAAYLSKFEQEGSARTAALLDAISDAAFQADFGVDASDTDSDLVGSLIQQNRNPRMRASLTGTWRNENWGAGVSGNYVSEFDDTDVTSNVDGSPYEVEEFLRFNGYVQYQFEDSSIDALQDTRFRLGVNNLFDREASLYPDPSTGYSSGLHSNRGRYVYLDIQKDF